MIGRDSGDCCRPFTRLWTWSAIGLLAACSGAPAAQQADTPPAFEGLGSDGAGRIRAHVLLDGSDRVFEIGIASPALATEDALGTKNVLPTPASPVPATLMPSNLVRWAVSECGAGKYFAEFPDVVDTNGAVVAVNAIPTAPRYGRSSEWNYPNAFAYLGYGTDFLTYAEAEGGLRDGLKLIGLQPGSSSPATGPVPFSVFSMEATTCDAQLDQEEVLTCAADKLLSFSESGTPVVWNDAWRGIRRYRTKNSVRTLSVDVVSTEASSFFLDLAPGQAAPAVQFEAPNAQMSFLLRDLAAQVLSYIPVLESRPLLGNGTTCAQGYASVLSSAVLPTNLFTPQTNPANPNYPWSNAIRNPDPPDSWI